MSIFHHLSIFFHTPLWETNSRDHIGCRCELLIVLTSEEHTGHQDPPGIVAVLCVIQLQLSGSQTCNNGARFPCPSQRRHKSHANNSPHFYILPPCAAWSVADAQEFSGLLLNNLKPESSGRSQVLDSHCNTKLGKHAPTGRIASKVLCCQIISEDRKVVFVHRDAWVLHSEASRTAQALQTCDIMRLQRFEQPWSCIFPHFSMIPRTSLKMEPRESNVASLKLPSARSTQ